MEYQQLIDTMSPELYRRLQRAIETGRWPDGSAVTAEQKQHAMQAVIAWGEQHLPPEQRVGFIDKGHKAGDSCDEPQPLNWQD